MDEGMKVHFIKSPDTYSMPWLGIIREVVDRNKAYTEYFFATTVLGIFKDLGGFNTFEAAKDALLNYDYIIKHD